MRKLVLAGAICLSVQLLLAASGKYQPLNIKTGLWETTSTTKISGRPPISPEMLAQMTPEQRARFEVEMNRMVNQTPRTRTSKTCLTKEKLEKDPFNDKDQSCKETVLSSTASKMEIREVCTEEGSTVDILVHIEALDSENVKGTVQSNASGGGNTMNVNGTLTSKYIGAVCKNTD
jgi:Protein of unknown function (DUF3617)